MIGIIRKFEGSVMKTYQDFLLQKNTGITPPLVLEFSLDGKGCFLAKSIVPKCVECDREQYENPVNLIFQIMSSSQIYCYYISNDTVEEIEDFLQPENDLTRITIEYYGDFNGKNHPQVSARNSRLCTNDRDEEIYDMCLGKAEESAKLILISVIVNTSYRTGYGNSSCPHCSSRENRCSQCDRRLINCNCDRCSECGDLMEDCEC